MAIFAAGYLVDSRQGAEDEVFDALADCGVGDCLSMIEFDFQTVRGEGGYSHGEDGVDAC